MKIFLGGTCNESKWRDEVEELLDKSELDYFNPVVKDWNESAQEREIFERENCDVCMYVITPKMTGVYSIAEVVDDSNKRPLKTVFCILNSDNGDKFEEFQIRSLKMVSKMLKENGSETFTDLKAMVTYLEDLDRKNSKFALFKSL